MMVCFVSFVIFISVSFSLTGVSGNIEMVKFNNLPEEIIVKIFGYFLQSQLQLCIANVCRKWQRITKDTSLYSHLQLDTQLSLQKAIEILQKYSTFIQKLNINKRCDTNDILKLIPLCENLQSLVINSCSGSSYSNGRMSLELNAELISVILKKNRYLSVLKIIYCTIQNGAIRITGCNLEKIVLKHIYYHRMVVENEMLLQNKLRILNLQGLIISKPTMYKIILNNRRTLHTLKLDVWESQLDSNDQIVEAAAACTNLRKLFLKNTSFYCVREDCFARLAELQLTSITFSNITKITHRTFMQLFKQPQSVYLSKIILNTCENVDGFSIKIIADNCPNLIKFGIHQYRTAEVNLIQADNILYLVKKSKNLQILDLRYTHYSIGISIPIIISHLPSLQMFKYCDCVINNSKISLISIYSNLNRNVVNDFSLKIEMNFHSDQYICGSRIQNNIPLTVRNDFETNQKFD